jgi:hypothetical protein
MRVEAAKPKWIAEAKKHAPFCLRPEEIQAVSRRDFLRQAKADHEANRPVFEKVIAQEREKLLEQTAEIRAEEKRKLREAWEGTSSVPEPEEYAVPPVDLERLEERRPRAQADFTEALAAHVKDDPGLLEHVFGR